MWVSSLQTLNLDILSSTSNQLIVLAHPGSWHFFFRYILLQVTFVWPILRIWCPKSLPESLTRFDGGGFPLLVEAASGRPAGAAGSEPSRLGWGLDCLRFLLCEEAKLSPLGNPWGGGEEGVLMGLALLKSPSPDVDGSVPSSAPSPCAPPLPYTCNCRKDENDQTTWRYNLYSKEK